MSDPAGRADEWLNCHEEVLDCPVCGGTGEVDGSTRWACDTKICSTCGGSGKVTGREYDRLIDENPEYRHEEDPGHMELLV